MLRKLIKVASAAFALALSAGSVSASAAEPYNPPPERRIIVSVEAPVSLEEVWRMWTTRDGLESFFAPEAHIDPRVDGNFSIFFYPDRPPGVRGAENMRILSYEPMRRFSYTWSAPVHLPYTRMQRSVVTVWFDKISDSRTRVSLIHDHFGQGPEWNNTVEYFRLGWSEQVMPYFLYAIEHGEVVWGMDIEPVEVIVTK